ncbi:MAG: 5'/3'-nucleotidase SurE [Clostridia bacterium]|nr:5'/3'-nucleotidase SurE [Clostridia bacterium]
MNILLTNDDGYESVGLMLLTEKLASCGHSVYVVAPDGQRSAYSHSVNLYKNLEIRKLDAYCGATCAYTCSGTPADCVKFAACELGVKFDLLVSGPNNGENYGFAVIYSGTVAAAEEGVMQNIKSIALSRKGWHADGGSFSSTVEYLAENLNELAAVCGETNLISINVPDLPMSEIIGVKVCSLGLHRLFKDRFERVDGDIWRILGDRQPVIGNDGTDVPLLEEGFITITPVSVLRTDTSALIKCKKLEK